MCVCACALSGDSCLDNVNDVQVSTNTATRGAAAGSRQSVLQFSFFVVMTMVAVGAFVVLLIVVGLKQKKHTHISTVDSAAGLGFVFVFGQHNKSLRSCCTAPLAHHGCVVHGLAPFFVRWGVRGSQTF